MATVKTAEAGRAYSDDFGDEHTVAEACDLKGGHWYCITHREGFSTQIAMHAHTSRGEHELVWICHEHGPEVA